MYLDQIPTALEIIQIYDAGAFVRGALATREHCEVILLEGEECHGEEL